MTRTELQVEGMTCAHCERAVTQELLNVAGVDGVDVDVASGLVLIEHAIPLSRAAVERAIDEAGYAIHSFPSE